MIANVVITFAPSPTAAAYEMQLDNKVEWPRCFESSVLAWVARAGMEPRS